jgi:hypothetical protein
MLNFQPYLKLGRAKEHFDALDREAAIFAESNPYRMFTQDDLESGQYIVTVWLDEPPVRLALLAGDFICCLRSSLDHLAWQLAFLTTDKPSEKICFPVLDKDTSNTQGYIKVATKGIPDLAITVMKSFQPYTYGAAYKTHLLWVLNKLWNIDKHRHLALHSGVFDVSFSGVPLAIVPGTEQLDDGFVMRFPLAAKQYMNLKPRVRAEIKFGDADEGIELGVKDFFDLYEFVAHKIIPEFASFFPQVKILRS